MRVASVFIVTYGALQLVDVLGLVENLYVGIGLSVAASVVFMGGATAYLVWLYQSVVLANILEMPVNVGAGWAIGSWFVPFVNFVRPYMTVSSLARAVGGAASWAPFRLWWLTWIVGNVRITVGTELIDPTIRSAILAASAVLCVSVMAMIQRELEVARLKALAGSDTALDLPSESLAADAGTEASGA